MKGFTSQNAVSELNVLTSEVNKKADENAPSATSSLIVYSSSGVSISGINNSFYQEDGSYPISLFEIRNINNHEISVSLSSSKNFSEAGAVVFLNESGEASITVKPEESEWDYVESSKSLVYKKKIPASESIYLEGNVTISTDSLPGEYKATLSVIETS